MGSNIMKIKLLTHICTFLLFLAYLTSCKKEEVKPVVQETAVSTPNAPKSINVEYRIYAVSSNFKVNYTAPNSTNDKLIEYNLTINKMNHSIVFDYLSGNRFKVEATNVNPSTKVVTVEIYINGILYSSASANAPNGVASADVMVY